MAHTNQTPNYGLSEFVGSDKPAWLVDYNGDMEKIDLGIKAAQDVADAAKAEADQGALDIAAVTVTANSADAKATGAVSDLADSYDSTSTYDVGDFVIYNNILYRCITAITVPESFDGTHWARTTVEEIIAQTNSNIPKHITTAITLDPSNISSGVRIDSLYVKTLGNVIALSMDFTTSVVKTALSTLFTITDAVPTPSTYYLFMLSSASTGKPVYFEIDGAGHIKNLEELPTGKYLGTFVYITT
jgi:hypothetical protein